MKEIKHFWNLFKSYSKSIRKEPKSAFTIHRMTTLILVLLIIAILLLILITVALSNGLASKPQNSTQLEVSPTISPTVNLTPSPTIKAIKISPTIRVVKKVTPTPNVSGTILVRLTHSTTGNLIDQGTKIFIRNSDASYMKSFENSKEIIVNGLRSGSYDVVVDRPSGYKIFEIGSSDSGSISISGDCGKRLTLSEGATVSVSCKYLKNEESIPGSSSNSNNSQNTPSGKPVINISYPQAGQNYTLSSGQQICIVSSPVSNAQNSQARYNLNNSGWTSYGSVSPCFAPAAGPVSLQIQFKNGVGVEGDIISINFSLSYN